MPPTQQAPFILKAMTLHGIGSYLHGARLELAPLTILCGKNGSGKSTWLNALNLLLHSMHRLPFGFQDEGWKAENLPIINAFYHLSSPADHDEVVDDDSVLKYGPPGTIGLEFQCVNDIHFSTLADFYNDFRKLGLPAHDYLQELFWYGSCKAGTKFRFRIAHPTYWANDEKTPHLFHLVELLIDETYLIRMIGERDPLQKFEEGQTRPRRSKPYKLYCSAAFIPGNDLDSRELLCLATVEDLVDFRFQPEQDDISDECKILFLKCFETRLMNLLSRVLQGYFYLGAIRIPHTQLSVDSVLDWNKWEERLKASDILNRRHVGVTGEHAWFLERNNAHELMRPLEIMEFKPQDLNGLNCLELLRQESRLKDKKLTCLWELADPADRDKLSGMDIANINESSAAEFAATFFNNILRSRDLASDACWVEHEENGPDEEGYFQVSSHNMDEEIDRYIGHNEIYLSEESPLPDITPYLDTLTSREIMRLNRLLIEQVLNDRDHESWGIKYRSDYFFESYVSHWMQLLTDSGINYELLQNAEIEQWRLVLPQTVKISQRPNGFMLWFSDLQFPRAEESESRSILRVTHPCFGESGLGSVQAPRRLSSGFHQIFPIIVQLGLMKKGEIFSIENPEVHLHPSLQLQITEALMAHAISGRIILVETQSDLVVRRIIRAILEEELAQTELRIYFANLGSCIETGEESGKARFWFSSLNPITIDENGRIANWPNGFMDDDIQESQRLMNIMYGTPYKEEEEGGGII